ncbi:DUF58 domain-containing protein [Marinimicrobium sp. ARAG 43.8]|uniref:DUF58 domain-containing protein n=1 Tax=Marinimicrobium sp. ARAG 43.8 TaxID=3418719 RepID=UPI003CF6E344
MVRPASDSTRELSPTGAHCELTDLLRLRFVARDLQLFARRPARSLLTGGMRTRQRGRGVDFEEVRLYQPGDDVRTIDWRVTARTQVPHTKIFREERERPVFVAVDQRASMFFGSRTCFKSVLATHISATIAWAALNQSDRIGGLVFGDNAQRDIRARRSKHAVLELLHQLHDYNHRLKSPIASRSPIALETILADARRVAKPGSAVFVVSDFHDFDRACEQQLFELARHTDVTLIHVYDPLEHHLGGNRLLTVTNGHERLPLPAQDAHFQQAYARDFEQRLETLTASCRRLALPLLSYATDDDIHTLLRERFGARRRIRN